MIRSFADKETEKIFNQFYSNKIPCEIQPIALRKLILIDKAKSITDLKNPPGNKLEKLKGDRDGQFSIRINDKYRICFFNEGECFYEVEIIDYH